MVLKFVFLNFVRTNYEEDIQKADRLRSADM